MPGLGAHTHNPLNQDLPPPDPLPAAPLPRLFVTTADEIRAAHRVLLTPIGLAYPIVFRVADRSQAHLEDVLHSYQLAEVPHVIYSAPPASVVDSADMINSSLLAPAYRQSRHQTATDLGMIYLLITLTQLEIPFAFVFDDTVMLRPPFVDDIMVSLKHVPVAWDVLFLDCPASCGEPASEQQRSMTLVSTTRVRVLSM